MTTARTVPDFYLPIVDEEGRQTQELNAWVDAITRSLPLRGVGSPEGVVEGVQTQLYMDETGSPGSVLYIKQVPSIGGDATLGWVLV